MSKDFDSRLDSLVAANNEKKKSLSQKAAEQQAATQEFYRAWTAHRAQVVAPALDEIAAALCNRQIAAQVREIPQYGIGLYLSTNNARVGGNVHSHLTFQAVSWRFVLIEYPPFHKEEHPLSNVTRELIEATALKLVEEIFGDR
jgi:hypothetical protein